MKNQQGFTLMELILVVAIITLFLGFTLVSSTTFLSKNISASSLDVVLSDVKEQQLKTMVGDTESRATSANYGIHFEQNKYTLFHCSTPCIYNSSDGSNFTVNLDSVTQLSNTFPDSNLVFAQATGEVVGFVNGQNTFIMRNITSGEQKTVTVNQYGVITQVN